MSFTYAILMITMMLIAAGMLFFFIKLANQRSTLIINNKNDSGLFEDQSDTTTIDPSSVENYRKEIDQELQDFDDAVGEIDGLR